MARLAPLTPPPRSSAPRGPSAASEWARENALREARTEVRLAWTAVPGALIVAALLHHTDLGAFLLRTFFGMWLHELGHAVAAWLCGFPAFPGPWFTPTAEERSPLFALLIMAGLAALAWRGWVQEDRGLVFAAAGAWLAQIAGTAVLRAERAQTLITFAGDAGSLVFGAALMAAFFVPPGHPLHRDWLRWGFLVIGAASFVDAFGEWWVARRDLSAIAFGEIEGRGDTDPTKLLEAGWTAPAMVSRYVGLGLLCLAVLAGLQVRHLRRTQVALAELNPPR